MRVADVEQDTVFVVDNSRSGKKAHLERCRMLRSHDVRRVRTATLDPSTQVCKECSGEYDRRASTGPQDQRHRALIEADLDEYP